MTGGAPSGVHEGAALWTAGEAPPGANERGAPGTAEEAPADAAEGPGLAGGQGNQQQEEEKLEVHCWISVQTSYCIPQENHKKC